MEKQKENGTIYKIINPKGKIYIGQTIDVSKRFTKYNILDCKGQVKLYRSLKKYGVINHIFEIIEECEVLNLNERERYWQDYYEVIDKNGLNCLLTKTNDKSGKHSIETCLKIKNNNSKYWLNKHHSVETKFKISKANLGNKYNLGKKHTLNSKMKMSKSKLKKVINISTGLIYDSVKEASVLINITKETLRAKLNGAKNNNTDYKYLKDYE